MTGAHDNTNGYVTGVTLAYDAIGEVTSMQNVSCLPSVSYAYDAAGNQTSMIDSDGGTTTSVYDAANQLIARTLTDSGTDSTRVTFSYDARGDMTGIARLENAGSGWTHVGTTVYDFSGPGTLLTGITSTNSTGSAVEALTYTYDLGVRIQSMEQNGSTSTYSYDPTNQIWGVQTPTGDTAYSYDANGNRNMTGYVVGTDNEITSDGTYTYTYDAEGNMTEKYEISTGDYWTYGYTQTNQLTVVNYYEVGMGLVQQENYQYDVFGNLVREVDFSYVMGTWTSTDIRHAYDMEGQTFADVNSSGYVLTRYLVGETSTDIYARVDTSYGSGQPSSGWLLTDQLGSVVAVQSLDGSSTLDALTYDAFGNVTSESDAAQRGAFAYTGLRTDPITGMVFAQYRTLNTTTGQWMSNDPIEFLGGDPNTRRYDGNNVIDNIDPTGLSWLSRQWDDAVMIGEYIGDSVSDTYNSARGRGHSIVGAAAYTVGSIEYNAAAPTVNAISNKVATNYDNLRQSGSSIVNAGINAVL